MIHTTARARGRTAHFQRESNQVSFGGHGKGLPGHILGLLNQNLYLFGVTTATCARPADSILGPISVAAGMLRSALQNSLSNLQ